MTSCISGKHLTVYTVLVSEKETLNNPLRMLPPDSSSDLDIEFVCFTDCKGLTSPTWRFIHFDAKLVPIEKAVNRPKAKPHEFFPDSDYSLYIDNTVVFKRLPTSSDLSETLFKAFRHPERNFPLDEADAVVKSGVDEANVVARQINFYRQSALLENINCLTSDLVLLRVHNHPIMKRFGELWWEQILLFSNNDQIPLDLCIKSAGCNIDYFQTDNGNNDLFFLPDQNNVDRPWKNFDIERYSWQWRNDEMARNNPWNHFLTHAKEGENYDRFVSWFGYTCEREKSGLGLLAAPRRQIADIIGRSLDPAFPKRILLVGVASNHVFSAEPEELIRARSAITEYAKFMNATDIPITMLNAAEFSDSAQFQGVNSGYTEFDMILVIGLPAESHANAVNKFLRLLVHDATLLLVFGERLTFSEIGSMYRQIENLGELEIFHSNHIMSKHVIPSSVFLFKKNSVQKTFSNNEIKTQKENQSSKPINEIVQLSNSQKVLLKEKIVTQKEIQEILNFIRPWNMVDEFKVRIGADGDGGYVMPSCSYNAGVVISLGIGEEVSFDVELAKRGARVYQFDHTIDKTPIEHPNIHFNHKGWGPQDTEMFVSLRTMISTADFSNSELAILKFDAELAEWESLEAAGSNDLGKFAVITGEFHGFQYLTDRVFFERIKIVFEKLSKTHHPIHLHPNNAGGLKIVLGIPIPQFLEITYLRKDLALFAGHSTEPIPGPLDRTNWPDAPDICLRPF
ncbi:MAG: DUF616 domain-containing protein [Candidatus Riflebacteria bacterium]|nr:DUF616 domain-containing protein [Candidatus Riflebacteria bacterium]